VRLDATSTVTNNSQEIQLDDHIKLLDSPGIALLDESKRSGQDSSDIGIHFKAEQVSDPAAVVKIPKFDTVNELLLRLAQKLGKLKRGGYPDVDEAARTVLRNWNSGRISFYTEPPQEGAPSEMIQQWKKELDFEQVLQQEQNDTVIDRLQRHFQNVDLRCGDEQ